MVTLMQIQRDEREKVIEKLIEAGASYRLAREITGIQLGTFTNYVNRNLKLKKLVQNHGLRRIMSEPEKKETVSKILSKLNEDLRKKVRTSDEAWKINLAYLLFLWIRRLPTKTRSVA